MKTEELGYNKRNVHKVPLDVAYSAFHTRRSAIDKQANVGTMVLSGCMHTGQLNLRHAPRSRLITPEICKSNEYGKYIFN